MKKTILYLIIVFLACPMLSFAVTITDSTTSDGGTRSTAASLARQNESQIFNVAASIPVGTVVAFPSTQNLNSERLDPRKWLECNGQSFSAIKYPKLYQVLGKTTVPNLNEKFLRGSTTADLTTVRKDTIRDHKTFIPYHEHDFSGKITTAIIYGDENKQNFTVDFGNQNVKTKKEDDYKLYDLSNMSYTRVWFGVGGGSDGTFNHETSFGSTYNGGYEQATEWTMGKEFNSPFLQRYKRKLTPTIIWERDISYYRTLGYTHFRYTSTERNYGAPQSEKIPYTDENGHLAYGAPLEKKYHASSDEWEITSLSQTSNIYNQYAEIIPSSYQKYMVRRYDGTLDGPGGKGKPYADGTLNPMNVKGSVSQKTENSNARIDIAGKNVFGDSDPDYRNKNGKMTATDLQGNEIPEMKGWYRSPKDKNGADKANTYNENTTETAPKHVYVRFFIRAEL